MLYPKEFGQDPMFPRAEDFEIRFKSEEEGKGVFTHRAWKKGDIMARMTGHRINEVRQHTLQISAALHNYDPYFSGCFLHACEPNISLDMNAMLVTALQDIPANAWLYMDYAETEDYLFKCFPCRCGSENCRGWVTGRLESAVVAANMEDMPISREQVL